MIEINLLPKEYHKRSFDFSLGKAGLYVIGGAVGVMVMLVAITFYQKHQLTELDNNITRAQRRAAMLQRTFSLSKGLRASKPRSPNAWRRWTSWIDTELSGCRFLAMLLGTYRNSSGWPSSARRQRRFRRVTQRPNLRLWRW